MRKVTMFLVLVLAFAVSALMVSAQIAPVETFDKNNPNFGSESQEASNPEEEDAPLNILVDSTIRVKNTGLSSITVNSISFTGKSGFTAGDIQLELNEPNLPFTLVAGQEIDLSFTARIPEDLSAVDSNFEEVAFNTGTINLLTGTTSIGSIELWMQRENQLDLNDINVEINNRERQSLDDGDTINDLKPGDNIEFEIEIENNFNDESNLDIEEVKSTFNCDDDGDLDFSDDEEDVGDIPTEEKETYTTTVDIEEDAKDGNVNCDLEVTGVDQNGAKHGQIVDFEFEITRENHDIQVRSMTFNPSVLSCEDDRFTLTVDMQNFGRSDEDEVAIEVTSKALGFQKRTSDIQLDEDDSQQLVFEVLVPESFKSAFGAFQVQTFYDNTRLSDTEVIQIENLCTDKEIPDDEEPIDEVPEEQLSLEKDSFDASIGGTLSIPVTVSNSGNANVEYTVSLEDISEFGEGSSSKTVFLNPGQSSTVFLNLKTKEDIEESTYSATVRLKSAAGETLETQSFTVNVKGTTKSTMGGFKFDADATRVLWIIADVVLVIVAIFFIRLIFVGGRKKKDKKMADYESESRSSKK